MLIVFSLVGTFLLVFLPALGLLIAGLAKEARDPALDCAATRHN